MVIIKDKAMRYANIILALFVSVLFGGCVREEIRQDGCITIRSVDAIVAELPATKAHLEKGSATVWDAGDQIGVFSDSQDVEYYSNGEEGDALSRFTGNPVSGTTFYAIYPANGFDSENRYSLRYQVPQPKAGTNPSMDLPMVAKLENGVFKFKQTMGLIHFSFQGNQTIKSLSLSGNNEEGINGVGTINIQDSQPCFSLVESFSSTIEFLPEEPYTLSDGETWDVYFPLAPMSLSDGFSLTITYIDYNNVEKKVIKKTNHEVTIPRAGIRNYTLVNLDELIEDNSEDLIPPDNEIWYTTRDNSIIDLDDSPFNSKVISHTYQNGRGIIRCDAAISIINEDVFCSLRNGQDDYYDNISHIYLPNSIQRIESGAFRCLRIQELRIPDNLQYIGQYAMRSRHFKRFTGSHVSEDGRCVILENGNISNNDQTIQYLAAFAPYGVSEYTLPDQVEVLGDYVFAWCPELKVIHFNEGLKYIGWDCFRQDALDCQIVFPSSLESLHPYAFEGCSGIKGFYGNDKFHTKDHCCLFYMYNDEKWINYFAGDDIIDYTIPEGIIGIENYTFRDKSNLKTITFPSTLSNMGELAIYCCSNLEALYGDCVSDDHRGVVFGKQFRRLVVTKGISSYIVPDGIESIGYGAFMELNDIQEVVIPDSVVELGGYAFNACHQLRKVVLSSSLQRISSYNPFLNAPNIEEIYFRSFVPPAYADSQFYESDCTHLAVYVPKETLALYKNSGWSQYAPYMVGYKYDDIGEWNPDYYMSTDYSANGIVMSMQTASIGKGINIVLMGDAFSDRQIADGTYAEAMQKAKNALFSEEPYKSMSDYFNVFLINVVSVVEGYDHIGQALGTGFGGGTIVYGQDDKVINYAKKAISEDTIDDALIIVIMNEEEVVGGTCYMFDPPSGDFGRGLSIAYFPRNNDEVIFNGLVSHEAGGHGFAKLADEYAYESKGAISSNEVFSVQSQALNGWWKNVDFTSDPTKVKWNHFLSDGRYANEGLGCYEGGLTYWTGVWRPTENSIMNTNTGGFNAPSREAIWYRIHKLAYGESWEYNYEDFVAWDQVNRTPAATSLHKAQMQRQRLSKPLPPLAPPVVIGHSWREEVDKDK